MRIGIDLLSSSRDSEIVGAYCQRILQGLQVELSERDGDHQVLVFTPHDYSWPLDGDPANRIRQIKAPAPRGVWSSLRRPPLGELIANHPIDVLHVLDARIACPTNIPRVVTLHHSEPGFGPGWLPSPGGVRRALRSARRVVTLSSATRDAVLRNIRGLEKSRVSVIHEGPDPACHDARDPTTEERIRQKYSLPPHFVLSVLMTERRSSLRTIARIAQELESRRSDSTVPWVLMSLAQGGVRGWKRLFKRRGLKSIVTVPGLHSSDLPHLLKMTSAFVYPDEGGLGFPILGALASGTPVITSESLSPSELVGKAAIRVDMKNASRVRECLDRVLRNRTVQDLLRMRGPVRAQDFSWEIAARKMLTVYEEALEI